MDGIPRVLSKTTEKELKSIFFKIPEARKWLADARFEDRYCSISSSSKMTVNTWFKYWIENIEISVARDATLRNHKNRYKYHIEKVIGHMIISEVKPMHCQNVLNVMVAADYAPGTIQQVRITMHVLFESAVENDLILKNPVKKNVTVKKDLNRENIREKRVLSMDEQKYFLDFAKGTRDYNQYVLMLQSGMRLGEVVGLRWQDVDFENRM